MHRRTKILGHLGSNSHGGLLGDSGPFQPDLTQRTVVREWRRGERCFKILSCFESKDVYFCNKLIRGSLPQYLPPPLNLQ